MHLLPEELKQLGLIGGALRADAPRMAAKFDMFTRLAGDEGQPPSEKQFRVNRTWRYRAFARQRRYYCFVLALVMVALAVVLALELT